MKAFILAAGFGTRLSPLTQHMPKPLLPVANVPLIRYTIALLRHHGIRELIVNLHHLGEQIEEALGDGADHGVHITYSHEDPILGTAGGVKKVADLLADDTFVLINSDMLFDLDLTAAVAAHKKSGAVATMVLRKDPKVDTYGAIEIDPEGNVRRFVGQEFEDLAEVRLRKYMFSGVHVLEPRVLEYIPPGVFSDIARYTYPKLLENREVVRGHVVDDRWLDLGTLEDYWKGNAQVLDRSFTLASFDPLAELELTPRKEVPLVLRLGADVTLGPEVVLEPPVVIGDGARIQNGARVGPYAAVGAGCVVGKGASVSESVLIDGAKVEAGEVVRRQIVHRKVSATLDKPASPPAPQASAR